MIKESHMLVRLITLWIIVVASLWLTYWSLQNLTVSVIKAVNGGYKIYSVNSAPGGYMGMGYNPCMQPPMYPALSSGQSYPGEPVKVQSKEDKVVLDKYNQEYQEYTDKLEVECRADLAKEEKSKNNQEKSSFFGDIFQYAFSSLLSVMVLVIALVVIKKSEPV